MKACLLNGVGLIKPRKKPGHLVWDRDNKDLVKKMSEEVKQKQIDDEKRLQAGRARVAAEQAGGQVGSERSSGPSTHSELQVDVAVQVDAPITQRSSEKASSISSDAKGKGKGKKSNRAAADFQASVVHLWNLLSVEEKTKWEDKAVEEHQQVLAEYEKLVHGAPSSLPEMRQA
jgi:hypothetical protein